MNLQIIRDYQIYLDCEKIGNIANGEKKEFQIPDGKHTLIAKIDWCSRPEVALDITKDQPNVFKVGGFKNANWFILIVFLLVFLMVVLNLFFDKEWFFYFPLPLFIVQLYFFTIGRKKYLTLTEIKKSETIISFS